MESNTTHVDHSQSNIGRIKLFNIDSNEYFCITHLVQKYLFCDIEHKKF